MKTDKYMQLDELNEVLYVPNKNRIISKILMYRKKAILDVLKIREKIVAIT